ncbi:MAG: hypothetical protein V1847_03180 [Candidatus Diapherotrites archaeon]
MALGLFGKTRFSEKPRMGAFARGANREPWEKKRFALNSRGQAAMTDALVLLFVTGALVASIFSFSAEYGTTVNDYLEAQYGIDYTTSALKTLLYASVPKNIEVECKDDKTISDCLDHAVEVDYLLAMIKQDYSNNASGKSQLDDETTREVLRQHVKDVMQNVSPSYDYLFSIQETQDSKNYVYMYLFVTNFPKDLKVQLRGGGTESFNCGASERGTIEPPLTTLTNPSHLEFYCTAKNSLNVQSLVSKVGDVSQAFSGITLAKADRSSVIPVNARAELKMWVSTCIPDSIMYDDTKNDVSKQLTKIDWSKEPFSGPNKDGIIVCQQVSQSAS